MIKIEDLKLKIPPVQHVKKHFGICPECKYVDYWIEVDYCMNCGYEKTKDVYKKPLLKDPEDQLK